MKETLQDRTLDQATPGHQSGSCTIQPSTRTVTPTRLPKPAKPPKTDLQVTVALRQTGGLITTAAKLLDLRPYTLIMRVRRNPDLQRVVEEERGRFLDLAEDKLKAAVRRGKAWAILFTLRTLGRDRGYVEHQIVQHTGEVMVDKLDMNQLAKLATELLGVPDPRSLPEHQPQQDEQ